MQLKTPRVLFALFLFLTPSFVWAARSEMVIMGDAGQAGRALQNLKRSVLQENLKSIIMPGDNLYSGTYSGVWDSWKKSGLEFDVVAIGNHNSGYQAEIDYFDMPAEYYSIEKFGARFLVLNSDNTRNIDEQMSWLEKEIDRVREKLVFLVYHHPTYSLTKTHSWKEKKSFQLKMRLFLKDHGRRITALLLGHDHISSFVTFGDVPVVVAGSGREVRNEQAVNYIEDGVSVKTEYLAPQTPHWAKLEISENSQEATVHFIRVSDQRQVCSADFKNGSMTLRRNCAE